MAGQLTSFEEELETELISEIKQAQQTGFVLGTEKFRQQFEDLTGFAQSHQKTWPEAASMSGTIL